MHKTDYKSEEKVKPKEKTKVLKVILHYVFFWPSIRKYATYFYTFISRKKKDKYDYWKD